MPKPAENRYSHNRIPHDHVPRIIHLTGIVREAGDILRVGLLMDPISSGDMPPA